MSTDAPWPAWQQVREAGIPISYRQFDYWCRTGLVDTVDGIGSGSQRMISAGELDRLARVARLLPLGIGVQAAHRLARDPEAATAFLVAATATLAVPWVAS